MARHASGSRGLAVTLLVASAVLVAACANVIGFPDRVLDDGSGSGPEAGEMLPDAMADDTSAMSDTSVAVDAGPAKAALSTTVVDFGLVPCGAAAPAPKIVTITNAGGAPLDWTASLAPSADFSITGASAGTIAPSAFATVTVAATAISTANGAGDTAQGALTITTSDPKSASSVIPIKRTAAGGTLSVVPLTAAFGETPAMVPAQNLPITVKNTGNQAVTIQLGTPTPAVGFTLAWTGSPAGVVIPPGGTMPALIAGFTPMTIADLTATSPINVTGALCGSNPTDITFTGKGTSSPASVQPGSLDFGQVDCGTVAGSKTFTIHNASTVNPFNWSASLTTGYYMLSASTGTVAASSSVVVTVTPAAIPSTSAVSPNLYGDTVTITTDVPLDNPHAVDLLMTAHGAILTQSTSAIDFGSVLVSAPATSTFTVSNSGNAPATVSYATTPAVFTASPQGQVVGGGASYTSTVLFAPTAEQTFTGTATMNAPGTVRCAPLNPPIALTGKGALDANITPSSVDFGLVACGATAMPQTVTLSNTSPAPFTWTGSVATTYYTINPTSGTLAKGKSVVITVTPKAVPGTSATTPDLYADSLTIQTTPSLESPYVASIHETAQGAILTFSPTSIDFGMVKANNSSKTKPYAVVNSGNIAAPITLKEAGPQFSIDTTTATASSGSSASLNATFTPTSLGAQTGNVQVTTTAKRCAPLPPNMTLTGSGM